MKTKLLSITAAFFLIFSCNHTKAQAWEKSSKILALGIGGSNFFHIYTGSYYSGRGFYRNWNSNVTGQLNLQGEFGIHEYVGLGFTTGIGGGTGRYWYGYTNNGELTVPIGMIANFHFFQLIADKTGKDIHADKLDVYAGVNVGSGIAVLFDSNSNNVIPIAFGGVQAGARYYFTDKFGVNLEVGYGKCFVNGGIVFRL